MQEVLLVLTNVPDEAVARAISRLVVEQRLAACVNILPPVRSVYRWQGAVEEASELPLLIKTTRDRYADLEAAIKVAHPYDVPEIVAMPVSAGLPAYLNWVAAESKKDVDV
ncbi:divalent-cation tolerance protein CutA [Noviherbaspirillum sp.]|uniref:divalent-cation tolerance protein CutA n=1 Tax=Noviherbaspirillum sp. TaxID=1926288 RepID=UPI0039C8F474